MRNLKFHEKKLLKKTNLDDWNSKREQMVTTKYLLHDRNTYIKYNRIVGKIRKITESIARLDHVDATKSYITKKLLNKLYDLGLIAEKKLSLCMKVSVSDFCRRRLPIVIKNKKMVENFTDADKFVQHGHFKIGDTVVNDCEVLVDKNTEQFIKWSEKSKIKKKLDEIHGDLDDFEYI